MEEVRTGHVHTRSERKVRTSAVWWCVMGLCGLGGDDGGDAGAEKRREQCGVRARYIRGMYAVCQGGLLKGGVSRRAVCRAVCHAGRCVTQGGVARGAVCGPAQLRGTARGTAKSAPLAGDPSLNIAVTCVPRVTSREGGGSEGVRGRGSLSIAVTCVPRVTSREGGGSEGVRGRGSLSIAVTCVHPQVRLCEG
jgi:hypothetical protein